MGLRIPVAHDYICPWCWIALNQVEALQAEFDVEFDWLSYELIPDDMEWPKPDPPQKYNPDKAITPSRMALAYYASNMEPPMSKRPTQMRSHRAMLATEWVKEYAPNRTQEFVAAMYRGLWEEGLEIDKLEVILKIADRLNLDQAGILDAVETNRYDSSIVKFDNEAYSNHVYNVPTFYIGDKKYAEQPLEVLRAAINKVI